MKITAIFKRIPGIIFVLTLTGAVQAALAQDEADDGTIEQIVVVGRITNVDVTAEDMERYQVNDLEDIFRHIPSVSVGGSLGIAQKIYVRGLEDTLLNVTVDGAPQTGTLFHHIGRVKIEPELLKTVSVQPGAGEATSGFGAIGGAVRFRTKDANDLLADDRNFGGLLKASTFSNDGEKVSASAYARLTDDWGLLASYVYVDRANVDDGDDNEILGTGAEQELGFVKLSGAIGDTQYLSLSYEFRDEEGEFGQRPNWPALAGDTLFLGTGERETFVLNYSLDVNDALNLEVSAYSTQSDFVQNRFDRWGRYGADIDTWGFDIRNTTRIGNHTLTYGVEHRSDEVVSKYLDDESVWAYWTWDPSIGRFEEEGEATAVYIQDHYQVTDDLLLSLGMRYDDYSFEQKTYDESTGDDAWSGNIGIEYSVTPGLTFSAGYAQAMRGKEIGDAFTLEKRPGRLRLDPELDSEEVENFEVGMTYQDSSWFASAVYFDMEIENVIFDQLGRGPFPQDGSYFENIGDFDADGYELQVGYQGERVRVNLSFSDTSSKLNGNPVEGYEQNGLGNARGDTLNLNADYEFSDRLQIGWSTMAVFGMDDIEVLHRGVEIGWIDELQTIDKSGYAVHDVYMRWQPLRRANIQLYFAVQNLFDKAYRDHSSVGDYTLIPGWDIVAGLKEPGRDIRLTLSAQY